MLERVEYSSRIGFIVTEACNIKCAHCLPESEPSKKNTTDWTAVHRAIDELAATGIVQTVSFTGGEPFLQQERLAAAIAHCRRVGLEATVITNAFWATSVAKAIQVLERMGGLTRLGLSADPFHQAFLPITRVRDAVLAAHQLEIPCAVRVCHLGDPDREIEAVREQLIDVAGLYHLEHQPVQPIGRAAQAIRADAIYLYDTTLAFCRSADSHAVNVHGDVTACCGATSYWSGDHALKFGNIGRDSMATILRNADRSAVLHAVRLWGPAGLVALVREQAEAEGVALQEPDLRANEICTLCQWAVADPVRGGLLSRAVARPEVARRIAVDRMLELGETPLADED